jgi:hypothetical protein
MHRPAGAEHGAELFKLQVPADERSRFERSASDRLSAQR